MEGSLFRPAAVAEFFDCPAVFFLLQPFFLGGAGSAGGAAHFSRAEGIAQMDEKAFDGLLPISELAAVAIGDDMHHPFRVKPGLQRCQ